MKRTFGTEFVIVNDVLQPLNPKVFGPGWLHLATVKRGLKEYVAFKKSDGKDVYIEVIDIHDKNIFKQIQDDTEWMEISLFLHDARLLEVGSRRDIAVGINAIKN